MRKIIIFLYLLITPIRAESVFPLDPAINYGKLENGLTYYIRENSAPEDKVTIKLLINGELLAIIFISLRLALQ